jgi:hypothetical protein
MGTLVRLIFAAVFLVGAAGSCVAAYIVGYSQGLNVHANSTELPSEMQADAPPKLEVRQVELDTVLPR